VEVGHILLQVGDLLLCSRHLVLGGLTADGVKGLPFRDGVACGDKDLLHGAALGQGDGGGILGLGVAAALDHALDGGDLGGLGLNLAVHGFLCRKKAVQEKAAHRQDDQGDDGVPYLFPLLFFLVGRAAGTGGGSRRSGGFRDRRVLLCHFCHVWIPPKFPVNVTCHPLYHAVCGAQQQTDDNFLR